MQYDKEFKLQALELSDEIGVKAAADQLGIKYYTLADWRRQRKARGGEAFVGSGNKMMPLSEKDRRIKELEAELPSCFYRLHRSYFVNCNYVAKIERYKLTLITGEELPIPKMRYMQIRNDITEMIQRKRKKGG